VLPGRHSLFSQQPLGQLAGVQTQEPFWHSVPGGQTLPHAPQLLLSVWRSTHRPTCGTSPPGQTDVPAGQTHWFPCPHTPPVGQHRLPHTRLFGQQNLSVPDVWSTRHVYPLQHFWAVQLWPAFAQGAASVGLGRSTALATAAPRPAKKPRRVVSLASDRVTSSNLRPSTTNARPQEAQIVSGANVPTFNRSCQEP
jgi:hypothetical protein